MQLLADRGIGFVGIKLYYPGGNEIQHGRLRFVEHVQGSGYPVLNHAKSSTDFLDAERISLCVIFACAMTRRETFERLGGLEEVFFPNGCGDVDICLRALDAGYRHYYLGSLEGIHHELMSRGFTIEDIEVARLHECHGPMIAFWCPRHLNPCPDHPRSLPVPPSNHPPDSSAEIGEAVAFPAPPASETLTSPSPPDSSAEIGEAVAFPCSLLPRLDSPLASPTAAPLLVRRQGHRGSQVHSRSGLHGRSLCAVESCNPCRRRSRPGRFTPRSER